MRDAVAWQEAAIAVLGLAMVTWEPLLEPTLDPAAGPLLDRLVAFAFPVLDLVMVLVILRLAGGRGRGPVVLRVMAVLLTCFVVSDAVYGVQSLRGTYVAGGMVDLGWLITYLGLGTLALHPAMREFAEPTGAQVEQRRRLRLLVLAGVAVVAPGVQLVQNRFDGSDDLAVALSGAALMFLLTVLRGSSLLRDLETLTATLRSREHELHRRTTCDDLTGLANRLVLRERIGRDLATGAPFCVALLDLDDFKHVNDSRGHEAGDALLLDVSRGLVATLQEDDLVARLGGDEFAVVSFATPQALAGRLVDCVARTGTRSTTDVTASVGIAGHDSGETVSELLQHADIAMYVAKSRGGGQCTAYLPEMGSELLAQVEARHRLADAVAQQQFAAWLQPVVDLTTHRLLGFEALARWARPGSPVVPPAAWMPAAEDSGLVVEIDLQVLRAAARQLVAWSGEVAGASRLDLAVNASGRSLREPDVAERVLAVLLEEGLPASRLVLEITEGVLIHEAVGPRLQRLRAAGVRIAVDDFGTGWSSLAYLRLEVVAEGVETPEQAQALRRLGCRTAQGFLYGRPAPMTELDGLVRLGSVPGGPPVVAVAR